MVWVVGYDISCNRRRSRVAKMLEKAGIRVQKSVFLLDAPPDQTYQLVALIAKQIDDESDRVTAWPLSTSWQVTQICFPESAKPLEDVYVIA